MISDGDEGPPDEVVAHVIEQRLKAYALPTFLHILLLQ